ncbi:MAG: hypothetical protein ACI4EU_00875 [Butyrivibrio sp.]
MDELLRIVCFGPDYGMRNIYQCIYWIFAYNVCVFTAVTGSGIRYDDLLKSILLRMSFRKFWIRMELCIFIISSICTIVIIVPAMFFQRLYNDAVAVWVTYLINVFFVASVTKVIEFFRGKTVAFSVTVFGSVITIVCWSHGVGFSRTIPWSYGIMSSYVPEKIVIQILAVVFFCLMSKKIVAYQIANER